MEVACVGLTSLLLAGPVVVVVAAVPPVAAVELVDKVVCAGPASVLGADGDGVSEITGPGAVGTTSVVAAVDATLVLVLPVTAAVDSTTEVDWAVVVAVPLLGKGTGATVGPVGDNCELSVLTEPGVVNGGNAEAGYVVKIGTVRALSRTERALGGEEGYEDGEADSSTERALRLG